MSIRCSQGHENPDGSAFCDECGEPLASAAPALASGVPGGAMSGGGAMPTAGATVTCPTCGASNAAGESFCANCGASLTAAPAPAPAASAPAPMPAAMPAASAQAPQLVVEADNSTFDLAGKSEVVIGREDPVSNIYPDVDLTPHGGEDGGVSRVHAKLLVNNGQYLLEDQNSTNFTYLNRQRLQPKVPTPVKDGDEIRLGRVSLRFHG